MDVSFYLHVPFFMEMNFSSSSPLVISGSSDAIFRLFISTITRPSSAGLTSSMDMRMRRRNVLA